MIKKTLKTLGIIILFALIVILGFFWKDANLDKYDTTIDEASIPIFSAVELPFTHQYDSEKSLPIAPSALIDIDNDGVDEVWFGGGLNQNDAFFKFENNTLVDITANINFGSKGNLTSTGVATADFDNNGFQDIIVSREDGLHLYYNTNAKFTHKAIKTPINEKSTPSGITLGDINKDGHLDIFLSTYIKKELMKGQTIFEDKNYGSTSELLLNDGNENFTSVTKSAGLTYIHNTFMAILVDIDNDTNLDLVVAHDTGEVRTYKNNGNLTFTMKDNPTTNKFAYPMGIAVGDYNNDGLVDFMFSNTGSTLPQFMAKGDIKDASKFNEKWIVFRNDGNFKFTDVAAETKLADYEFSWGAVFADMNNDGLQDLMVAENYIDLAPNKLFRLPSRMLIQKNDNTFVPTETKSGVKNPNYAITPLVSDFNKDGHLDMIWTNIGTPSLAYLNKGNTNHFVQVNLPKNAKNIGAIVTLNLISGKKLTDFQITGEGLASDQTSVLHFGLGNEKSIKNIIIKKIDGSIQTIENPKINEKHTIE
nr:CRTAC1 family protein [uncultured Flavobacterium sp.]